MVYKTVVFSEGKRSDPVNRRLNVVSTTFSTLYHRRWLDLGIGTARSTSLEEQARGRSRLRRGIAWSSRFSNGRLRDALDASSSSRRSYSAFDIKMVFIRTLLRENEICVINRENISHMHCN